MIKSRAKNKIKKTQKFRYELLAPAGDFSTLVAGVNAGADAVYFGLKEFNMRESAKNFHISDLPKIKKICKSKGKIVKMYLTLNTIIYDDELKRIEKIIKEVKGKVDAVICWDPSVIQLCRKHKIPFHISTQASVANTQTVHFYKKLGAERIILARELSLKQIKQISKIPGIDIEVFIHGAMCVSVSGRCFTSQFLFGKSASANRGKCMHPCRRTYFVKDDEGNELRVENNKIFSAKDLCALPFIEKLKKAGVRAFKIEGRNREARYVDTVTKVYRKALDKKLTKQEINHSLKELSKVYNKEFSSGFFLRMPTSDDFSKTEHSSASQKKHFIGKVIHYFPKIGVAAIKLFSDLKLDDEVVVIGDKTGIINSKVQRIEINKKPVQKAEKNQEVGVKLSLVRKNDEVYVIKEKRGDR